MRGSFFGMNIALSGLFTAQRNQNTIAHNTANMQTVGFSRQTTIQSASSPIRLYNKTGMVGTGVDILAVTRMRDFYLDQKIWYQKTVQGAGRKRQASWTRSSSASRAAPTGWATTR